MSKVLLLNSSYLPIKIITVKKALKLLYKGKAEGITENMEAVVFPNLDYNNIPNVIRLLSFSGIPINAKLSKKNVVKRDNYRCAYCGNIFSAKDLTVDHIIPKSRGGKFTWQNLVSCCFKDNNKKGNRTPEEANMKLLYQPRVPSKTDFLRELVYNQGDEYEHWKAFFPS